MPKLANEVVFIQPSGFLSIRLTDGTTNTICEAARNLKARYFVAIDPCTPVVAVWGVFDMRRAQKNNPTPGQWSTEDPIKTFPFEAQDAAVMYALALAGRG